MNAKDPELVTRGGIRQVSQSADAKRLADLRERIDAGKRMTNYTRRVAELALTRGISARQAYRYVSRGTEPSHDARCGGDGKVYHIRPRGLL
jgi:hypothetical protein